MEVFINEQKVDFTLVDGMTVQQVIDEINSALAKFNKVIVEWKADGDREESYLSRTAADFDKFEVKAEDIELLAIDTISSLSTHLDKILKRLLEVKQIKEEEQRKNELAAVKTGLIDSIQWIRSVITNSSKILKVDINTIEADGKNLVSVMDDLEKGDYSGDNAEELILSDYYVNTLNIKKMLPEILIQFKNFQLTPENKIKLLENAGADIDNISANFEEAAISFQQDEKQKASAMLQENILKVQNIISLIKQSVQPAKYPLIKYEEESFKDWIENFSRILQETLQAYERNDEVELADMLEYEISPNIKKLGGFIKSIVDELQK